jgi:hypothetical protein
MRRVSFLLVACAATYLSGCGGSGLPDRSSVTVTITPAQATVKAGSVVALVGTESGFTQPPIVSWWIEESKVIDFNNDCGKLDSQAKDFTGCPYGFVMFHDVTTVPSTAYYYAPQTAGVYHVTVSMLQPSRFEELTVSGTAAITVTP